VHPMLVGFPIGLWVFALVCDVVHAVSGSAIWQTVATFLVAGGIVGALLAAVPGLIDYFSIGEAEAPLQPPITAAAKFEPMVHEYEAGSLAPATL